MHRSIDLCGDHHQSVTAPEDTGGSARVRQEQS